MNVDSDSDIVYIIELSYNTALQEMFDELVVSNTQFKKKKRYSF